ncbi:pirin family protein [Paraburkholderia rhizosphaerae]|uniref:Redox-sensitive bicupin YhaK (Pirin superfamily) n=1 Tax=Paraburkholderia rhizosphaerae TaxID=480658 RepID=A0A4R8LT59_9BURK|nr:pirin family protein [Paraburkholderia rhizosphaerae]TDY50879.1 redox-sensitive bicupin YhaK (pirin superfamily) [Paraburkholderia rhizosphaerae]
MGATAKKAMMDAQTPDQLQAARTIFLRTKGRTEGPSTRLASPSDIGQAIKPFVLIDRIELNAQTPIHFQPHPHSGIATLTALLDGGLQILTSKGKPQMLTPGAIEWMQAGRGTWHGGPVTPTGVVRGYQLWIALPPELELAEPYETFLPASEIPIEGPARVLLGQYNGVESPLPVSMPMTYLHVELNAGEHWRYDPPSGHDVLWIAVYSGSLDAAGERVEAGEMIVFNESERGVDFIADDNCGFMLGSAQRSPFDVVEGYFSVHTNAAALQFGELEIARVGAQMRSEGRLDAEQAASIAQRMRSRA